LRNIIYIHVLATTLIDVPTWSIKRISSKVYGSKMGASLSRELIDNDKNISGISIFDLNHHNCIGTSTLNVYRSRLFIAYNLPLSCNFFDSGTTCVCMNWFYGLWNCSNDDDDV